MGLWEFLRQWPRGRMIAGVVASILVHVLVAWGVLWGLKAELAPRWIPKKGDTIVVDLAKPEEPAAAGSPEPPPRRQARTATASGTRGQAGSPGPTRDTPATARGASRRQRATSGRAAAAQGLGAGTPRAGARPAGDRARAHRHRTGAGHTEGRGAVGTLRHPHTDRGASGAAGAP